MVPVMNSRVASDNNGRGPFRAVILDYGAVLCELPFAHEIERMSEVLGVTVAAFPALYASKRKAYDRGDLTTSEYWNCMALAAKTQLKPENREADALAAGVEVTPENIDSEADAHAAKVALNNENTGGEGDALAAKAQLKPENTDREAYAPAAGVELTPETIRRLARWDMEMWSRINVEMREWVATLRAAGTDGGGQTISLIFASVVLTVAGISAIEHSARRSAAVLLPFPQSRYFLRAARRSGNVVATFGLHP